MVVVRETGAGSLERGSPSSASRHRFAARGWERPVLVALLLVTAVKQLALALVYPPFQGHDEVAHLGYLYLLATQHRLPTLADNLPASLALYSRFTLDWPALYTANHPPLYYLLAWPAYQLAGSNWLARLYAVRLVSIPLFLLTIWLAARLARALAPGDPLLVIGVPAVIAFQPQLSFEGAIVNNDMLAICLGTALLYLAVCTVYEGLSSRRALLLGLCVGLGLLAKATVTALLPVVIVAALYACWPRPWAAIRRRAYWRPLLARGLLVLGPATVLPLPWYLFLHRTYGDFDAFRALDELQASWGAPEGTFWQLLSSPRFHWERLQESWGEFGWKLIPLPGWENRLVALAVGVVILGILVGLWGLARSWRRGVLRLEQRQVVAVGLVAAALLLLYGAMIYFGALFALTQARYAFPGFPAGAVLGLLGLRALVPAGWQAPATAVLVGLAGGFYLLVFLGLVVPYADLH